ncbi:MAG: hypothetical protein FWD66_00985 [Paludibacter sp.]|nr:hypothetical protein [Paludibacter sp.]
MKGIIFIEPMFHAVVEGRKTQTRRIVKPQPKGEIIRSFYGFFNKANIPLFDDNTGKLSKGRVEYKPCYRVGEKVYIGEPYWIGTDCIYYKYGLDYNDTCWLNKLYMPAKYARYFIEITAVRCERLQDISDEDCLKEGIRKIVCGGTAFTYVNKNSDMLEKNTFRTARKTYAALINKINGKGTWESNPYVWVYEFKLTNNQ